MFNKNAIKKTARVIAFTSKVCNYSKLRHYSIEITCFTIHQEKDKTSSLWITHFGSYSLRSTENNHLS